MNKRKLNVVLKQQNNVEQNIRHFSEISTDKLFEIFNTSFEKGISHTQVNDLKEQYEKNIIVIGRKNTMLRRLIKSLINPFNLILLFIASIIFILDVALEENPDYITVVIILALVLISSTVSFIQGEKSNTATEALTKMIRNKCDVVRDGKLIEIDMEDVLPGDLVKLSAGDMIPADVRFIRTKDTFVGQSALTGESNPVEKFSAYVPKEIEATTDLENIGFMGSNQHITFML